MIKTSHLCVFSVSPLFSLQFFNNISETLKLWRHACLVILEVRIGVCIYNHYDTQNKKECCLMLTYYLYWRCFWRWLSWTVRHLKTSKPDHRGTEASEPHIFSGDIWIQWHSLTGTSSLITHWKTKRGKQYPLHFRQTGTYRQVQPQDLVIVSLTCQNGRQSLCLWVHYRWRHHPLEWGLKFGYASTFWAIFVEEACCFSYSSYSRTLSELWLKDWQGAHQERFSKVWNAVTFICFTSSCSDMATDTAQLSWMGRGKASLSLTIFGGFDFWEFSPQRKV